MAFSTDMVLDNNARIDLKQTREQQILLSLQNCIIGTEGSTAGNPDLTFDKLAESHASATAAKISHDLLEWDLADTYTDTWSVKITKKPNTIENIKQILKTKLSELYIGVLHKNFSGFDFEFDITHCTLRDYMGLEFKVIIKLE